MHTEGAKCGGGEKDRKVRKSNDRKNNVESDQSSGMG